MDDIIWLLELGIVIAAFSSGVLWFRASRRHVRRVSKAETLDYADLNRIVTALNRTQILNSRAAIATATASMLAGLRLLAELVR